MRRAALFLLVAPLAVAAQSSQGGVTHTFDKGLWTIAGTEDNDTADVGCNGGNAQVNGTDPAGGPVACDLVIRIEARFLGGVDNAFFRDIGTDFENLDPLDSGLLDGGDDQDLLTLDFSPITVNLILALDAPAIGIPTGADAGLTISDGIGDPIRFRLGDRTGNLQFRLGLGHDLFRATLLSPGPWPGLVIDGSDGDDEVDATGSLQTTDLEFIGGLGNDLLRAGLFRTRLRYPIGGGTDTYEGGDEGNDLFVQGLQLRMGLHGIGGFLGPGCAFFDFNNTAGVEDEGVDRATITPGTGGGDVFFERDCFPIRGVRLEGSSGDDQVLLRGRAGGNGRALDVRFDEDMFIFADGFESGDTSSWSTGSDLSGGGPWDGMDYQDWPSFTDPSTSGPSTVVLRGEPDFPVTIDLGPDQAPFGNGGVDSLLVDPMGLTVDDDGSRILIGSGPPITYAGVEVVRLLSSTDAETPPEAGGPVLEAFPTPTRGPVAVRLGVVASGHARVVLLDARGREVRVIHEGVVGTGSREWTVGGGLPPGLYLVRAVGDRWAASHPVVVAN